MYVPSQQVSKAGRAVAGKGRVWLDGAAEIEFVGLT